MSESEHTQPNPIPTAVRGGLYVSGIVIGGLGVVTGPLIVALGITPEWSAVIVSTLGAVTTLLSTLSRANLSSPISIVHAVELETPDGDPPKYAYPDGSIIVGTRGDHE